LGYPSGMIRFLLSACLAVSFALAQPAGRPAAGFPSMMNPAEVLNYPLTMDKVEKWASANRTLLPYMKAHADTMKNLGWIWGGGMAEPKAAEIKNLDDMASWVKAQAGEFVALIEGAGLTFKDYLLITFAISTSFAAEAMSERGGQMPAGMPIASPANVAFMKANKARIMQIFSEYQKTTSGR
jgi:hypothetical protein